MVRHEPEEGRYGDCWRTCIACLLDLRPDQVPHFLEDGDMDAGLKRGLDWLRDRGLALCSIPVADSLEKLLGMMGEHNPDTEYMLIGTGKRSGVPHVVIGRGGRLVHDPEASRQFLSGPVEGGYYWLELLVPISKPLKGVNA